jgi:antitoxin HicB
MRTDKVRVIKKFKVAKEGVTYEFETAEEGGYVVSVPLYPSCVSQGDTFEEALANIEDALLACLLAARDLQLPIPEELQQVLQQTIKS